MDNARKKMEEEHRKLVDAHKCKELEKKRQKLLKTVERYSFLKTDPGYKLRSESTAMNAKDDDKMKLIRQKQQEMYSRTNVQKD